PRLHAQIYRLFTCILLYFFFTSRRRHTISKRDWSSDVCYSDLEKELVQLVENMIKEQFRQETLIPSVQYPNQPKKQVEQHKLDFDQYVKQVEKDEEKLIQQVEKEVKEVQSSAGRTFNRQDITKEALMDLYKTKDKTVIKEDYDNEKASDQINQDDSIIASENRIPTLYPIGQYRGTYILAQNEDGLYMID